MWRRSRSRRRKRGDGTRGPRSSAASPKATAAYSCMPCDTMLLRSGRAVCVQLLLWLLRAIAPLTWISLSTRFVDDSAASWDKELPVMCTYTFSCTSDCTIRVLYGGEASEAIRFMEDEMCTGCEEFPPAAEVWLAELEDEKRLIEALSVVKSVRFSSGETLNDNKCWANLLCCWSPSMRTFKSIAVACDERSKPTHLEALRELHAKIVSEHCSEDHTHHPRAVERREATVGSEATPAGEYSRVQHSNLFLCVTPSCMH